jgi:hypothetical protein
MGDRQRTLWSAIQWVKVVPARQPRFTLKRQSVPSKKHMDIVIRVVRQTILSAVADRQDTTVVTAKYSVISTVGTGQEPAELFTPAFLIPLAVSRA